MGSALALVLIIALVIKPIMTGQPINTGIATPTTTIPVTAIPTIPAEGLSQVTTPTTIITTIPTTVPTWDPANAGTVDFVNPASYGVTLNQSLPGSTRIDNPSLNMNMTTFATIKSDNGTSGTTKTMYIPFPYWEIVYTVEPYPMTNVKTMQVEPTKGEGISYSGIAGSYSTATPQFTVQVMDGNDPNRIVRTFSPPGGIDLELWKGEKRAESDNPALKTNQKQQMNMDIVATDPRPWTEKFYEGQRSYYFIVTTQSLKSYKMEIKIPNRYIGQY